MKKILKHATKLLSLLIIVSSCQDDDNTFGKIVTPTNLELGYQIVGQDADNPYGDGSGNVILTAHADDAITYKFMFPDETSTTEASGETMKRLSTQGSNEPNSYIITVIAYGKGGVSTSGTIEVVDLLTVFNDPVTTQLLTNNSSKTWYWAASEDSHLGVGPNTPDGNNYWPEWYQAQAFEKAASETSSCLYDNVLTFTLDGNLIKYELNNGGATFFNAAYTSVGGGDQTEDTCLEFDTSGQKTVSLEPADSVVPEDFTTGTQMVFGNGGFMGYYIGTSTYEILELTENRMVVRAVQGNNTDLAWYHIFTTEDPNGTTTDPVFENLVWSDEFDYTGAPDATKWNMELGGGGWGNQEVQIYKAENANVSNGTLKITLKKESNGTYTSARMTSHNKFDFTYGKVEYKAKLPTGGGTWPALWMLGSNYNTNPWPGCGEIDVMEHVGNDLNTIHGTLHYPGNSGGNANGTTTTVDDVTQWHTYSAVWTEDFIKFYVDDNLYKTFNNSPNVPFNHDFFIIMNVAMGGTFGGTIDPAFTQGAMEVEYVRVYQ